MVRMIKWILAGTLAVTNISCPSDSQGAPVLGQDFLAAQSKRFNTQNAAAQLQPGASTGNLDWTFGQKVEKLEPLLQQSPKYHRTHLINGVCVRNGNCGRYELGWGYSKASFDKAIRQKNQKIIKHVRNRTAIYRGLASRFPGTQFLISPVLEHDLSREAYRVLADTVLEVWPNVQLVNSVNLGIQAERYKGAWVERHGNGVPADTDINSLDGVDATDIDVPKWMRTTNSARILFVWTRLFNCRTNGAFLDPRERTNCPRAFHFEELSHITDDRGNPPGAGNPGCNSVRPFAAPAIWKPLAENKANGDKRADLPVAITPFNAGTLQVLARNGAVVGKLGYYGAFQNNLFRHYSNWGSGSGVNGYTFEKNAVAQSGSPWVWIKAGGKCMGPFVPGRRAGSFRD